MSHKAASVKSQGEPAKVVDVKTTSPSDGHILVKNHAWAINPVDYYQRDTGGFVRSWPALIGSDCAGEVIEVGSGVTTHKKGDRVLVATTYLLTGNSEEAGFQELTVVPAVAASKIPDEMSFADAVVVPLSAATSAAGLYGHLGLDLPSNKPTPKTGQKLLVWGAGSSVAASAIQLAVASGYEVVTTCSQKHFDYAKKLGASKVFDYNSPSVVGDLTAELHGGTCVGAFDAISKRDTQLAIATVLAQLGGGKIAAVLPVPEDEIPATVDSKIVFALAIFAPGHPVGKAVFQDFLPKALATGQFVPQPKAEVVGNGLEALNEAMNVHQKGVSAKKIVVTA